VVRDLGWEGSELEVTTPAGRLTGLRTRLLGAHQAANAAIAAATAVEVAARHRLDLDDDAIQRGLDQARWPGRLEPVAGRPPVLIDGAHNPAAVSEVVAAVESLMAGGIAAGAGPMKAGALVVLFGAMSDKDWPAMLRLLPPDWPAVLTSVAEARAAPPADLLAVARGLGRDDDEAVAGSAAALDRARDRAGPEGMVLVLGSLDLAGEVRTGLGL